MRYTLLLLFALVLAGAKPQENYGLQDVAYKFDPTANLQLNHRMVTDPATGNHDIILRVFFRGDYGWDNYEAKYALQSSYGQGVALEKGELQYEVVYQDAQWLYLHLKVPRQAEATFFFVELDGKEEGRRKIYLYDIALSGPLNKPHLSVMPMQPRQDLPYFAPFIRETDSLRFQTWHGAVDTLWAYRYTSAFDAALPPMEIGPQPVPKAMTIDTLMPLPTNQPVSFPGPGLYFIQEDTSGMQGITLRCTSAYFPKRATLDEVVAPLRYIATNNEWRRLHPTQRELSKKDLDAFWLDMTRSPEVAKLVVKNYFQNVALTNQLFTHYKEGWKSDRGMIYTLYGPPGEVFNDGRTEEWLYISNSFGNSRVLRFRFNKVPMPFSDNAYVLERRMDYLDYWNRTVDMWRRGLIRSGMQP